MAEPFSTNELFLRSDRIAFGKIPPEVIENTEQTLILPDLTGSKLYFGLSSLVSTSGLTGTLEAIYPNYASFTFDNLNSRLGINVSTPQYSIDISTLTGVRIQGGSLIANASGLVSVPTASLFSTLPSYVFGPGTIPVTAIASTGGSILPGVSVPTSALFSTLPTSLFAPSSIPLVALQSSGIIVASSFVGDGFYLSNIPLANINGTITGDFFRPNSIPLSTLASTGQIWIRNPEGSIFVPTLSTSQLLTSSLVARNVSTVNLTTNRFIASSIQANYFESATFAASNLSAINIKASSLEVLCRISAGTFSGDGQNITNLTPAALNTVIPSDKFGYRLISINAINPYGDWQWIAGTFTLQQAAPIVSLGDIRASSFHGGVYFGDGRGLYNLPSISTASLVSTVRGLGTAGYVSTQSLTSSLTGLGSINYVSTASLVSTVIGLSHSGFISSSQLNSTIEGLGTLGYVSSTQLQSTVAGLGTANYISTSQLNSTLTGLTTLGYVSTSQFISTIEGLGTYGYVSTLSLYSSIDVALGFLIRNLASFGYISSTQLNSTLTGLASLGYVSTSQLTSTVFSLETQNYSTSAGNTTELVSSLTGLGSLGYISSSQLLSTVAGLEFYASSFIDLTELASTVTSLGTFGYVSTLSLTSTVQGLGSAGYISSSQFLSTTQGLGDEIRTSSLFASTIQNTFLTSQAANISSVKSNNISSFEVVGEIVWAKGVNASNSVFIQDGGLLVQNLTGVVPYTIYLEAHGRDLQTQYLINDSNQWLTLVSQTTGNYIFNNFAGTDILSLTRDGKVGILCNTPSYTLDVNGDIHTSGIFYGDGSALYNLNAISSLSLQSTVEGLGTSEYVSTASLYSSINQSISSFSTAFGAGGVAPFHLASTVIGLGTAGYVSTLSLVSTTQGLQSYISSFIDPTELASSITSTVIGIGLGSNLASTVQGLGTSGYVSTLSLYSSINGAISSFSTAFGAGGVAPFHLASTVIGLGTAGYVSTLSLRSTVAGLGTAGYTSTATVGAFFSSLSTSYRTNFNTVTSVISALTVSSLTFGTGDGFLAMPDIRPTSMSTLVTQTSSLQAFNLQIGATSSITAIQFYGLVGNFNTTVLAERSTGIGTQELLFFKGSSTSDQIRFQTTGIFEIETGVSSRVWPNTTQNPIPSFLIDGNSNVGIQTASPATTLDVAGTGRFQILSTLQLNLSSLSGIPFVQPQNLFSTVGGLGTAGYISTASLISTVDSLGTKGYISSLNGIPYISALQIIGSSIFATLAGPTTVVLYEF